MLFRDDDYDLEEYENPGRQISSRELAQGFAMQTMMVNPNLFDVNRVGELSGVEDAPFRDATTKMLAHYFEKQVAYFLHQVDQIIKSPIEKNFMHGLVVYVGAALGTPIQIVYDEQTYWLHTSVLTSGRVEPLYVYPQYPFHKYKLDFLLSYAQRKLAVECDGRKYHNATKTIRKDNRKDLQLQSENIPVVRFTGQELYQTPLDCARQAVEFLMRSGFVWKSGS